MNVVIFLLGNSPTSEFYMPTFRNTLSVPSSYQPVKMEQSVLKYSFTSSARAECDDFLPFSGASSIPLCYVLFPATLLHQLFFHPLSPHLAIYFLVYLSNLLFPNSYKIPFWEFYFLPFSVHAQTNVIYLTLLSLL